METHNSELFTGDGMRARGAGGHDSQILYCNERELLLKTGKFFLLFPAAELNHAVSYLNPSFDLSLRRAIIRVAQPGAIFVDFGANVGGTAAIAARRIGRFGSIITVEPVTRLAEFVKRNLFLNAPLVQHVHHSVAAGMVESRLSMQTFAWDSRSSTMFPEAECKRPDLQMIDVDVVPASRLIPSEDGRNLIIKIDAEGAEFDILTDLLGGPLQTRSATLIVEYAPSHLLRAGSDPHRLAKLINDCGFTAHFLMKNGMRGDVLESGLERRAGNLLLSRRN